MTETLDLAKIRRLPICERADWCANELYRSARALSEEAQEHDSEQLRQAAWGTRFMAETMENLAHAYRRDCLLVDKPRAAPSAEEEPDA